VVLSVIDRDLLDHCLAKKPRAWEDFVDRFMGLVVHVVNHCAQARSIRLSEQDRDDLCSDVFLALVKDDYAILRNFRRESSLATYLTVIARRIVVKKLLAKSASPLSGASEGTAAIPDPHGSAEARIEDHEEVLRLIGTLGADEAQIVKLYHLDGKSYREISQELGIPENSVGPTLSRARAKMRTAGE